MNQVTGQTSGGKVHFRGTANEPATVTVAGNAASVDAAGNFDGVTNVNVGANTIAVVATDASSNTRTNNYQVNVPSGVSTTLLYDLNGNLTNDGSRTYEWDAANRCTAINQGTHRTEFSYDGAGRRAKIIEKDNGTVTGTKQFVWRPRETQPCEEMDGSNSVTRRFYVQGEQIDGSSYYYTHDHLGSVRELTDSATVVRAVYDYDPYGIRTKSSGDLDAQFGYTGHYYHQPTGLHLAPYRAYDGNVGRWISRDPLTDAELLLEGPNLYAYVGNNLLNRVDPTGRNAVAIGAGIGTLIEPGGGTIIGAGIGLIITIIVGAAIYDRVHNQDITKPRVRDEECEQRCYDAYEEHCHEYCAKLPTACQREACYRQAMITHNICVKNCYK